MIVINFLFALYFSLSLSFLVENSAKLGELIDV